MSAQASQAGSTVAVDEQPKSKKKEKPIKNQFNYQDRGTQSSEQKLHLARALRTFSSGNLTRQTLSYREKSLIL